MIRARLLAVCLLPAFLLLVPGSTSADEPVKKDEVKKEEPVKDEGIVVSDGRIQLTPAADWVRTQPRTRIVEHEFVASIAEGDADDARITVMGAGGTVEQNIDRWIGQFTQPEGKSTRAATGVKELDVAGQKVHVVEITGTYRDQLGPFAQATIRENYRMLGAIIVTEKMGRYYLKMVGPKDTVDAHEKAFGKVIESLTIKAE
jgi:hypothetical protein